WVCPKPLIRLWEAGLPPSEQVCARLGHDLNLPALPSPADPRELTGQIADALARVHLAARLRHVVLISEMIDEPLERWEKAQRRKVTDAARNRKEDALEAEFWKVYEAELREVQTRWGVENPAG